RPHRAGVRRRPGLDRPARRPGARHDRPGPAAAPGLPPAERDGARGPDRRRARLGQRDPRRSALRPGPDRVDHRPAAGSGRQPGAAGATGADGLADRLRSRRRPGSWGRSGAGVPALGRAGHGGRPRAAGRRSGAALADRGASRPDPRLPLSTRPGTVPAVDTLSVAGCPVLVIGGGADAMGVVAGLRQEGAVVTVAATELVASLEDLADRELISWHRGPVDDDVIAAAALVVATAQDPDLLLQCRRVGRPVRTVTGADTAPDSGPSPDAEARPGGEVVLVGGGPGHPDLLTVGGLAALRRADVIVTDR